jgi:hypothetical protein
MPLSIRDSQSRRAEAFFLKAWSSPVKNGQRQSKPTTNDTGMTLMGVVENSCFSGEHLSFAEGLSLFDFSLFSRSPD